MTTRNRNEIYTAQRVLQDKCALDGGIFIPLQGMSFRGEKRSEIADLSFHQSVAFILNQLFDTELSGWDVEFCIGRNAVRYVPSGRKAIYCECWHNVDGTIDRLTRDLLSRISQNNSAGASASDWTEIAIRAALTVGILTDMMRGGNASDDYPIDISVPSGDFWFPAAIWLVRSWGLPVRNIICSCVCTPAVWELFHQGELHTDAVSAESEIAGASIVLPRGLEAFIALCAGEEEAVRYAECCRFAKVYAPCNEALKKMRSGMYISVIGENRVKTAIWGEFRTHQKLISGCTALALLGYQDFCAANAVGGHCLIFSEQNPENDMSFITNASGLSADAFYEALKSI